MRFTATVDTTGYRQARDRALRLLEKTVARAPNLGTAAAITHARSTSAFTNRTGYLKASIHAETGRTSPRESWNYFVAAAPYALFVEGGTKPHEIWPKEGHGFVGPLRSGQSRRDSTDIGTHRIALRWYVGGKAVFARMVHHPGTSPRPYMWPAGAHAEATMIGYVKRALAGIRSFFGS